MDTRSDNRAESKASKNTLRSLRPSQRPLRLNVFAEDLTLTLIAFSHRCEILCTLWFALCLFYQTELFA